HVQAEEDRSGARRVRPVGDERRDLLPRSRGAGVRAAGRSPLWPHRVGRGAGVTQGSEAVASPDDVLGFWRAAGRDRWFERDDRPDAQIRSRFLATYEAAASGRLDDWQWTREGTLALLILLDQFPRNLFRNDARAYATDNKARAIAKRAIAHGTDRLFP